MATRSSHRRTLPCFSATLDRTRPAHLRRTWARAVDASHLAHTRGARGTGALYDVKNACISWIIERDPEGVVLTDLKPHLVGIGYRDAGMLHVPVRALSAGARARVVRMVVQSLTEQPTVEAA